MTTKIYIDPTAFNSGKPLESYSANKPSCRVQVGQSDTNSNINGAGLGIIYHTPRMNQEVARASITVTIYPIEVDDTQVNRWNQFNKNALADLVAKGIIIVERPVATPLSAAAIRAL